MYPTNTPFLPFQRHALALALTLACSALHATTINVSGNCSFYSAIKNADTDSDTDGNGFGCPAGNGDDIINLNPKSTHFLLNAGNADGLPIINSNITINGKRSTVNAQGMRAFNIGNTGKLTINKLTITQGAALIGAGILNTGQLVLNDSTVSGNSTFVSGDYYLFNSKGGGIYNSGSATLSNSRVINNSAYAGYSINGESGRGGGIYNNGNMTLSRSTVSNNEAIGSSARYTGPIGGGIFNIGVATITNSTVSGNTASNGGGGILNRGAMTLTSSTISRNNALSGGGIYNGFFLGIFKNSLTLSNSTVANNIAAGGAGIHNEQNMSAINSTISGNKASNSGGGIANKGNLALTHSTLSGNQALTNKGGGIFNLKNMTLTNTLIANSKIGGDCLNSSGGVTTLQGINLVEDGGCNADIVGDPKLGLLVDNGGPTPTHALLANSPALNVANQPLCNSQDQRGVKRPQPAGSICDLGAFERMTSIPNSVINTVQFFDNARSNGGIIGTGNANPAKLRSIAFRNQLLSAGNYKEQSLNSEACVQLSRTLKRIDNDNTPDANDYITGNQANALTIEITSLQGQWSCL